MKEKLIQFFKNISEMTKILTYTIIGVAGTIIITLLFNFIFRLELQSCALFFIIPIGGIYVGIGSASGLFYSYLRYNKLIKFKQFLIALVLGIATFYGIYYASYLTTYINGDHISNYEINGERISFTKYLELEKSSAEIKLSFGNLVVPGGFETGKTYNTIMFYLQLLGSVFGSIGIGLYFLMEQQKRLEENKKYQINL
ncbi:MAG: hypothetical protein NC827_10015 [Candidatus Omnitrophica bacterium]|nr:hypothetical protein [Candidatus Omnitrophota bacterium]